jgi:hypothetical protein
MTVTVGTGGTYNLVPAGSSAAVRQFAAFKLSAVVLYRCAREYTVSPEPVVISIQPEGGVHEAGMGEGPSVGEAVSVRVGSVAIVVAVSVGGKPMVVAVGVGKLSGNVGGICVGVAAGGNVSARDRKMPPAPGPQTQPQR